MEKNVYKKKVVAKFYGKIEKRMFNFSHRATIFHIKFLLYIWQIDFTTGEKQCI